MYTVTCVQGGGSGAFKDVKNLIDIGGIYIYPS